MKTLNVFFCCVLSVSILLSSCREDGNDPTPTSKASVRLNSVEAQNEDLDKVLIYFRYNQDGKLIKIDNNQTDEVLDILHVSGGNVKGSVNGGQLYDPKSPDLLQSSEIHPYHKTIINGNVVELSTVESVTKYDYDTGGEKTFVYDYTYRITYDNKINPLFLLLDQQGVLPTVDDLMFNSVDPAYASLSARGAISRNNPVKIEVFDQDGHPVGEPIIIDYQYNSHDLPDYSVCTTNGNTRSLRFFYTEK